MGYFEKLYFGNAVPLDEIQNAFMKSERGRELTAILSKASQTMKDGLAGDVKEAFETYRDTQYTVMELQQIGAFKLGFAYGAGLMREIEQLHLPFEPE